MLKSLHVWSISFTSTRHTNIRTMTHAVGVLLLCFASEMKAIVLMRMNNTNHLSAALFWLKLQSLKCGNATVLFEMTRVGHRGQRARSERTRCEFFCAVNCDQTSPSLHSHIVFCFISNQANAVTC